MKKFSNINLGKDKLFGFFVGQAMKETQGKGNPKNIKRYIKENAKVDYGYIC